jgi:hypothetical protein
MLTNIFVAGEDSDLPISSLDSSSSNLQDTVFKYYPTPETCFASASTNFFKLISWRLSMVEII